MRLRLWPTHRWATPPTSMEDIPRSAWDSHRPLRNLREGLDLPLCRCLRVCAPSPPLPYCRPMRRGLPVRMLAGLLIGIVLGVAANLLAGDSPRLAGFVQYVTEPAGRIFLRLLFMLVIPLILSALALGVAGLGDMRSLGRIGLKTLVYTVSVSAIAVLIGITLVDTLRPGEGLSPALKARLATQATSVPAPATSAAGTGGMDFFVGTRAREHREGHGRGRHARGDGLRALPGRGARAHEDATRRARSSAGSRGSTTSP